VGFTLPTLPAISENEKTPLVLALLGILNHQQEQLHWQREQIQSLKDEIARLKGQNPPPEFKPSALEGDRNGTKGKGTISTFRASPLACFRAPPAT